MSHLSAWDALVASMPHAAGNAVPIALGSNKKSVRRLSNAESTQRLLQFVLNSCNNGRVARSNRQACWLAWLSDKHSQGVSITQVRAAAGVTASLQNKALVWRNSEELRVGFSRPPAAKLVRQLLCRADHALKAAAQPWRDLLSGLLIAVFHPFLDGNGRVARLYWARGLAQAGFEDDQIVELIAEFFGTGRMAALPILNAAQMSGDPAPFVARWETCIRDLRTVKKGILAPSFNSCEIVQPGSSHTLACALAARPKIA